MQRVQYERNNDIFHKDENWNLLLLKEWLMEQLFSVSIHAAHCTRIILG
jgi:hypothetical protein